MAPAAQSRGQAAEVAAKLRETIHAQLAKRAPGVVHAPNGAIRAAQALPAGDMQILVRAGSHTVVQMKGRVLEAAVQGQLHAAAGPRNEQTARQFLRRHRGLLRVQDPDAELNLLKHERDDLGERLRFSQSRRGLPVWPAGLRVHVDRAGNVNLLDGAYMPTPAGVNIVPNITSEQAVQRAKASLSNRPAASTPAELIIYAPLEAASRLAWRFDVSLGLTEAWRFVVDALNGRILHRSTLIHEANATGSGIDQTGAPMRNLKNPGSITIPGWGAYPAKMSQFVSLPNTLEGDHGGVHVNSSIINHAFYLLAEGLPEAVGRAAAERIFYRALTQHLQAQSQFIDCRLACVAAAGGAFRTKQRSGPEHRRGVRCGRDFRRSDHAGSNARAGRSRSRFHFVRLFRFVPGRL